MHPTMKTKHFAMVYDKKNCQKWLFLSILALKFKLMAINAILGPFFAEILCICTSSNFLRAAQIGQVLP